MLLLHLLYKKILTRAFFRQIKFLQTFQSVPDASHQYQKEPTVEEIAKALECETIDVILAYEAIQDTISMSTPIYDNGGDVIELEDQIASNEAIIDEWSRDSMIKKAIKSLSKREKNIIEERYFKNKTQVEIADELGISQAQVSRLEKNALQRMRELLK